MPTSIFLQKKLKKIQNFLQFNKKVLKRQEKNEKFVQIRHKKGKGSKFWVKMTQVKKKCAKLWKFDTFLEDPCLYQPVY